MNWRSSACAAMAGIALASGAMLLPGGGAIAATGDVLKVTAERANLRAGPSDKTEARGQVQSGEEVIELQRQGDWVGVRVGRTGEEGWIYGNLVQLATASRLSREAAPSGFKELSPASTPWCASSRSDTATG